jgi:hypothetical protein
VPEQPQVTDGILWAAAICFAAIDAPLVWFLARVLRRARFLTLKRTCTLSAFVVWTGIWLWALASYWQEVYAYFFPAWARWCLPFGYGALFALAACAMWAIAVRLPIHPVIGFVAMGAALGPITHAWAVSRGLLENPPMLRGVSPAAAIVISAPEFALYWSVILALAAALRRIRDGGAARA